MRDFGARPLLGIGVLGAMLSVGLVAPIGASAHGELVFQIGSDRVAPGGVVEVRGDLGVGSTVDIVLISQTDGTRRSIASFTDLEQGHFQAYVKMPEDVAAGSYLIEASADAIAVRAPLIVAGYSAADGGDRPGQDEPLLAPLPSASAGDALRKQAGTSEIWSIPPILVAMMVVLAALAVLGGLRARGRRSTSNG